MKKITLLVLLFAVVGNIKAAHYEYIPLVRDGVEWGYSQQLFGKSYYRNLIQADTIVNDIAYKKFYTFESCSETADKNLAFIRESGKQVYITFNKLLMPVESLCDREYLIYDFGVKEGETITHFDWITQQITVFYSYPFDPQDLISRPKSLPKCIGDLYRIDFTNCRRYGFLSRRR